MQISGSLAGFLPAAGLSATARYDAQSPRHVTSLATSQWQVATSTDRTSLQSAWSSSAHQSPRRADSWSSTMRCSTLIHDSMLVMDQRWQLAAPIWRHAISRNVWMDLFFEFNLPCHQLASSQTEQGIFLVRHLGDRWLQLWPFKGQTGAVWQDTHAVGTGVALRTNFAQKPISLGGQGMGECALGVWRFRYERTRQPPWGRSVPRTSPPPPVVKPRPTSTDLQFCCEIDVVVSPDGTTSYDLNFTNDPCPAPQAPPLDIPVLRFYFMEHHLSVVRLPNREAIAVTQLNLRLDDVAWTWDLTASIPINMVDLVSPTAQGPTRLEITVNEVVWIMIVESIDTRFAFAQKSVSIRGRSTLARLSSPYASSRSFSPVDPLTARQFAQSAIDAEIPSGEVTLQWGLPDWLIPGGACSLSQVNPMSVVQRLVQAVGGVVYAHPQRSMFVVQSRYPTLPWEWATAKPDRSLPVDVLKTLSVQWQHKPPYNAVYISGERTGVVGHVKRGGTAGDLVAPMVVDSFITEEAAARERGRAELGSYGKQALVSLEMPFLSSIGLLTPGLLLDVSGGQMSSIRGMVRSTQITAQWSGPLIINQQIELEQHFDE